MLLMLFLVLCALLTVRGTARAADPPPADTCTADRLKGATVDTAVEFVHRGSNVSSVTSVTDITVPANWEQAPHLSLDAHSFLYRAALRCLLGKGWQRGEETYTYDYEWRLKPLSVKPGKNEVRIHYEAVAWVQNLSTYEVGLWTLTARRDQWTIQLRRLPNLAKATWKNVAVRLGGPAALTALPPTAVGKGRAEVSWDKKKPDEAPQVEFRPPASQQWAAISQSPGHGWEMLGGGGVSGAFGIFATGILALIAGRRLRLGLGRNPLPAEEEALRGLRSWALILVLISLVVYLGDDLYGFLQSRFSWRSDYGPVVSLFSVMFIGVVLCFFGKLHRSLLIAVCALAACAAALYVSAEMSTSGLLPTSDFLIWGPGKKLALVFNSLPIFLCFLGLVSSGQRLLILGGRGLSQWAMAGVAAGASAMTLLWAYRSFGRSWERRTWLNDSVPNAPDAPQIRKYDQWWWWWFASDVMPVLADIAFFLTPLALVVALRVCRAEQYENDSFTPNASERTLLVIFFAVIVVPNYATYFGFSGYITTLVLGILAAWALLTVGRARSVLEQPAAGNAPLGQVILRTDRSELLRRARRYRELQFRLRRPVGDSSAERSESHEAVERKIERMDQCLPQGVRPIDLPFAFGPMASWWGNACRCALIASFIGLPATGLMYWLDVVGGDSWSLATESVTGFLTVVYEILYWQVTWVSGGFFLGALWRDLPGRNGPTKALSVAVAFAVPVGVHEIIAQMTGQGLQNTVPAVAAFASVMTFSGLVMDVQTFRTERRYRSSSAGLLVYIYRMPITSVAVLLAQLVALVTILKYFREGGSVWPFDMPGGDQNKKPEPD
ncbi:DUF6185 family protein [Streptomyces sp. NPDC127051]|uniref:DUF6185 family protein n=1 Tax=Streptomyces sp. NPDC127051 TaxID=3347119 RepID=UPI0036621382